MAPEPEPDTPDDDDPNNDEPDDGGNSNPSPVNLSSMTKAELLNYAEENGVQGVDKSNTKAEILDAIRG